jgi:hypothetical protein
MAITTTSGFYNALTQKMRIKKNGLTATGTNLRPQSLWSANGVPGAGTLAVGNTTTGVLFDDTYTGAPIITDFVSGNTGYIKSGNMGQASTGSLWLYDRIWGVGAISLTSLATTTFSSQPSYSGRLPTGANYAVDVFIEMVTTASATATTVDVTYTNENGINSRSFNQNNVSGFPNYRLTPLSLQNGDKGVQSIDSVTVGGTVATTGSFNIIVARRLAEFHSEVETLSDRQNWDLLGMPQVFDTSCLWLVPFCAVDNSGPYVLNLEIING